MSIIVQHFLFPPLRVLREAVSTPAAIFDTHRFCCLPQSLD